MPHSRKNRKDKQVTGEDEPVGRNVRFEQEIADARDHDKQSGTDDYQKKPAKTGDAKDEDKP
jgi:hypothetical protein